MTCCICSSVALADIFTIIGNLLGLLIGHTTKKPRTLWVLAASTGIFSRYLAFSV
jgi:hypothetical protein